VNVDTVAILREEVAGLRAEVAALRDVFPLAYEAGRADALGQAPRVRERPRHLTVIRDRC
jgi:hypothetical protein